MQGSPPSYYHYTGVAPQSCTKPSSNPLQKPCPSHLPSSPHLTMASLAILLLLARISGSIAVSSNHNSIARSSQQLVIASVVPAVIPDADGQSVQPFLTSPSGSYAAYLRRALDSAGSLSGDTCYVQIQQAAGGGTVWESDCTPVGGADTCDLAFSPVGLEIFAGGHSLWDTGIEADPGTLQLDDDGDMSILSKEGVTVWKASAEPRTGQQCGAASAPASSSSADALPPPSTISTKLETPPAATLAGTGSSDFPFGDQLAPPPVDTVTGPDVQPPVDTAPEQPLAPPPEDAYPDLPDPSLPPPPAYTSPDSPDQPLAPPPADVPPDQPLFSSPPPAPAAFGPQAPLLPPFGIPLAPPPAGTGATPHDTPFPGGATAPPHGEPGPGSPGAVPFGSPHKQGAPHHDLPVGASPPLPGTLAPSGHGEGAGLPYGHGQPQPQQGVFGQQPQLLNGEGHPLEDVSAGWPQRESGTAAMCVVLAALVTLCFGF